MSDELKFPEETITPLQVIEAPWSREITLQAVDHESGLRMLRLRIKEGRARFTIIDLDERTARTLAGVLTEWAGKGIGQPAPPHPDPLPPSGGEGGVVRLRNRP